ncbi:MAG: chromosome segregation protein SMC [Deltaproteobacteria bacterium]|nr:chromosome segregation protein SMC [Deltaproteobacteria bacterium]
MKIRKLDIIGFKSFTERTRLRFDDGITGIVGPNGCGKSNVVDAIRWVMGEQSARKLRGKFMEDVIFAGSETRPPMGMAEVMLTFENDGRNMPPEYADYPEIRVGRRLFRSGESEYTINRTACRLLDVQELFMGTGVGTRAYSIIGQGQIGLLVSQKPTERRSLIEEAAGVSKYKARRKVAERKMEYTRQNLLRVQDVLLEIRRSMGSLQRQARKAARYHKLRGQLREIELHDAAHRCLELQALQRHAHGKQQRLQMREAELHSQIARLDASVEQGRTVLLDEDRGLADLQERLLSTDNQIRLCEQNVEFLSREVEGLTQRGQETAQEVQALRGQLKELSGEVERAEQERDELAELARTAARRLDEREQVRARQATEVERMERQIDSDRQARERLGEEAAELRGRLAQLQQRILDIQSRLGQATGERSALDERIAEMKSRKSSGSERLTELRQLHLDLVQRREFEENALVELQSQARENEARGMALREEIERRRSRLESLQEIERNYEGCLSGVQCVMRHAREDDQFVGLVADILQAPPRYETAVQAVLGDRLQSVIVKSQQAGLEAVDYLKSESEGRSSFIPMDLRPSGRREDALVSGPGVIGPIQRLLDYRSEYDRVVDYLLGDVVLVEDLSTALQVWSANGHRATLVTLDGEILEPQGVLTGGSLEGAGTHLLESKREIRELTDRLQSLEAEHRMVQDRQGKLRSRIASCQAAIDSLRDNSHDEEIRIVDQKKDLGHLDEQLAQTEDRARDLVEEHGRFQDELASARQEKEQTTRRIDELRARQEEIAAGIRSTRDRSEKEKGVLAELVQEVTELRVQSASAEERCESSRRNLEHLFRTRQDLESRVEKLHSAISSGNIQSIEGKQRIEDSQQEISTLLATKERQQTELAARRSSYEKQLAAVQAEQDQVKSLRRELESTGLELSQTNLHLQEIELGLQHLRDDVRRQHKAELFECLSAFHLLPPPGEGALQRAQKIRHDLDRMGDVNPNAVEEYEQQRERHDFLSTQAEDLSESLDKLQKVIVKINRTSRKRFKEAFESINAKFTEVFPRLFRGGRAHLSLDENQDLLEAGVEIAVQPPGKKLQNIELLSGGEKALTAVALLFSIFLVKPTPFCLLDEVDAPLDDVNIDRFNAMVKEMSASSQFILITHNKRTMEMLDRLYGVTMEEPGISTIVTVRLTDGSADALKKAG